MDLVPKRGKITRYRRRLQAAKKVTKKAKKGVDKGGAARYNNRAARERAARTFKRAETPEKIRKNLLTDGFRSDIINGLSLRKRPRALKKIQKRA